MKRGLTALFLIVFSCVLCGNVRVGAKEGKAECVMELSSRRILYEANGDTRLPMASTTKIVTAAAVLTLCNELQEEVTIPVEAEGVEGSSVYLKRDEKYTVEELLYGLMLRSGNDCATALALHCAGDVKLFSAKMNEIAQKAGALNSNFQNPHGLPASGHYTTAHDLTAISCWAMQNPVFKKIVATKYYEPRKWQNKNKMLSCFDGGIGIKTGYTKEAGRCLVSAAERDGMTLVCTLLNCPTTYERTSNLFEDAFSSYRMEKLISKDETFRVGEEKGISHEEYSYPLLDGEKEALEYCVTPQQSEIDKEIIGVLEISLAKRLLFSTNLYKL